MAERPKLAMRCKAEEEKGTVGLTEQPKRWRTRAPNLIPWIKAHIREPRHGGRPRSEEEGVAIAGGE